MTHGSTALAHPGDWTEGIAPATLSAPDRWRRQVAYVRLRDEVIRPLRDTPAERWREALDEALAAYERWAADPRWAGDLRGRIASSDVADVLSSTAGRMGVPAAEVARVVRATRVLGRYEAAAGTMAAEMNALGIPLGTPGDLHSILVLAGTVALAVLVALDCLSDPNCPRATRLVWLDRLEAITAPLGDAMERHPDWGGDLAAVLRWHRDVREALGRGDLRCVRAMLDAPDAPVDEAGREYYRRFLRTRVAIRQGPSRDLRAARVADLLPPSPHATWVAVAEGREVVRAESLAAARDAARARGASDPLMVWRPAAGTPGASA